jgi:hypothetical protein
MQAESIARVLPRTLFPYVQRWAERSGLILLSRLLADDEFCALIEKYGDEVERWLENRNHAPGNGSVQRNGSNPASRAQPSNGDTDADACDSESLRARVLAMEAQQEGQQAGFEALRAKMRPLALALGCCPDCFVGVDGCSTCSGRSKVAHYEPDYTLLATHVVNPLAARGVPVVLNKRSHTERRSRESTATKKRSRQWSKK